MDYLFEKAIIDIRDKADIIRYRAYISDSIKNLTELIIKIAGGKDIDIPRYVDLIAEIQEETEDDKKAAQEEAEKARETAEAEFKRQCELIARERNQKKEREQSG